MITYQTIGHLAVDQMKGNEQRVLLGEKTDYRLVSKNIDFFMCKSIDNFLRGESDCLFNVEKTVEFLSGQPDGIISMGCGAILSKKEGILTYRRFVPVENSSNAIHHLIQLDEDGNFYKQATLERNKKDLEEMLEHIDFYKTMGVDKKRVIAFENNFKEIATGLFLGTKQDTESNTISVENEQQSGKTR